MLGIQDSWTRLETELLQSPGRENCRLHGVFDLVQPLHSSFWPSAGLLTEFCNIQISSVSSLHTCVHMYSCLLMLSLALLI